MAFPFSSLDFRWLPLEQWHPLTTAMSSLISAFSSYSLITEFTHFDFWKKNPKNTSFVMLYLVSLLLYMFPWFPEICMASFFPYVKERSMNVMSCIHLFVAKCHSNNYKYLIQILDKFWLQHSHNKNSDASCLTFFQKGICFMNALALKIISLPSNPCVIARTLGKSFISRKERRTCQLMMTELL